MVGEVKVVAVVPPIGNPAGAQFGARHFAHENGVLAGAAQVIRPEIKLVARLAAGIGEDQRIAADAAFGLGQIEGDFRGETIMLADDEHGFAGALFQVAPFLAGDLGQFLPAENAAQRVEAGRQSALQNFRQQIRVQR